MNDEIIKFFILLREELSCEQYSSLLDLLKDVKFLGLRETHYNKDGTPKTELGSCKYCNDGKKIK